MSDYDITEKDIKYAMTCVEFIQRHNGVSEITTLLITDLISKCKNQLRLKRWKEAHA